MEQKKSFFSTPIGIITGCGVAVVVLLLCACIGFVGLTMSGALDSLASSTSTPVPASSSLPSSSSSKASVSSNASFSPSVISQVVMARDVQGATFNPIGISDTFGPEQSVYHAVITVVNAPANTSIKAAWIAVDTGGVAAPNTSMGEYALAADGSRNLDFTFEPNAGKLPAGKYRVDISVNGTPDRSINFTVTGTAASSSASSKASVSSSSTGSIIAKLPTASASSSVVSKSSASSSAVPKSTGLVASVTMAEGTQGANKDPQNPTTVFKPTATFHAVVRTNSAPANTKYGIAWYTIDVGSAAPPNTLIDNTDLSTDGTRNIDFTLEPNDKWPNGTYRVEVTVNGILDTVKTFSVSSTASSSAAPSSSSTGTLTECGAIPAGQGGLLVVNYYGQQINYTIAGTLYKIDGNAKKAIFLAPGKQNYSANIPGLGDANGSLDIVAGQCLTQSWANK